MAFTFSQLQQMVYVETNRPDAVAQTTNALLSATLVLHSLEFFYKDLLEALVVFDTPNYLQQLSTTDFTRFRSLHTIRKWDPTYATSQADPTVLPPIWAGVGGVGINQNVALRELTCIDTDDIFDSFRSERVDVYYQVGSTIKIKSSTSVPQAIVNWYSYPNLDQAGSQAAYSSWIANEYPFALVYYAASNCFGQFGDQDTANRYCRKNVDASGNTYWSGMAGDHINNLIRANIVAKGW